jgi:protein SCO1
VTRPLRAILTCVLSVACAVNAPAQLVRSADEVPERQNVGVVDRKGEPLPLDAPFIDAQGREVTLGDYFDGERPVLLLPLYFDCPVLCPTTRINVLQALNGMSWTAGEEYRVVCYSFDHTEGYRTAATMQRRTMAGYTKEFGEAGEAWAFLTTPDAEVAKRVSSAIGFHYRFVPEAGEYSHVAAVFFATPDGVLHNVIEGLDFSGEDLQKALKEARDGEKASVFAAVYTWCFPYDPETGENSPAVWRIMTVGASASAVLLFATIGYLIYRTSRSVERRPWSDDSS